jgi:hypothetical protein
MLNAGETQDMRESTRFMSCVTRRLGWLCHSFEAKDGCRRHHRPFAALKAAGNRCPRTLLCN